MTQHEEERDALRFDALWTIAEVAIYLSVTTQCVRNWERHLALPVHMIGANRRYVPSEVLEWVRSRCSVNHGDAA